MVNELEATVKTFFFEAKGQRNNTELRQLTVNLNKASVSTFSLKNSLLLIFFLFHI